MRTIKQYLTGNWMEDDIVDIQHPNFPLRTFRIRGRNFQKLVSEARAHLGKYYTKHELGDVLDDLQLAWCRAVNTRLMSLTPPVMSN